MTYGLVHSEGVPLGVGEAQDSSLRAGRHPESDGNDGRFAEDRIMVCDARERRADGEDAEVPRRPGSRREEVRGHVDSAYRSLKI